MLSKKIKVLLSDIAPLEGRTQMANWQTDTDIQHLTWAGSSYSLSGNLSGHPGASRRTIRFQGNISPSNGSAPSPPWIELETIPVNKIRSIPDLYLTGTRPLPHPNIICISRHPVNKEYLVAATSDSLLLLLDARLPENLKIMSQTRLASPIISLVCCGQRLLGLGKYPDRTLYFIEIESEIETIPGFIPVGQLNIPVRLSALAENDSLSAWGLSPDGKIYALPLPAPGSASPMLVKDLEAFCCLQPDFSIIGRFTACLNNAWLAIKSKWPFPRCVDWKRSSYMGLAYDGHYFWSAYQYCSAKNSSARLLRYNQLGAVTGSVPSRSALCISSLNYIHNNLLVLDLKHQQLHLYHMVDSMQPALSLSAIDHHPGYLPGGTPAAGDIYDLCLLYVGAAGKTNIHRYDADKLRPLVGYLAPTGDINDFFMDGFLILAQYSPLLNGRSFGTDLKGKPSRKEDWLALFDEYFHPEANLHALNKSTEGISRHLHRGKYRRTKVVLAVPAADPRCTDWDNEGLSLETDVKRVEVTEWAIKELLNRWSQAVFPHLTLVGFYYMTEQGAWNDKLLQMFPQLCHKYGLRAFAIPGITSTWITEFTRAGFDCVALQSSHAFWQPRGRPRYHLLKSAGRVAREFMMGMEVELPYEVLEPAGRQKLRDYLTMAYIQGWAGAFKAYFQSYNLIQALAESPNPECRQLYDDLYRMSRLSRRQQAGSASISSNIEVDYSGQWEGEKEPLFFQLNIEDYQGIFELSDLVEE